MPLPIRGFMPALVTPFGAQGELRVEDFAALVRHMLAIGADGLCVAGDNGESWALSLDERRRLLAEARRLAGGRVPVILGASAPTTAQAVRYAEVAAEEGADAILLMPPTYVLKATREELVAHFAGVARAVPLPIVAYDSPRRTGIALSVDDIAALCDAAPIVALKASSRDIHHFTEVIRRLGGRLSVMTGPASFILLGAALGAHGFISSGPELMGRSAARLMEIGRGAPTDQYRAAHNTVSALYEALMRYGTWPSALKAALSLIGLPAGVPRAPVHPLPAADRERLAELMRMLGLERAGQVVPR